MSSTFSSSRRMEVSRQQTFLCVRKFLVFVTRFANRTEIHINVTTWVLTQSCHFFEFQPDILVSEVNLRATGSINYIVFRTHVKTRKLIHASLTFSDVKNRWQKRNEIKVLAISIIINNVRTKHWRIIRNTISIFNKDNSIVFTANSTCRYLIRKQTADLVCNYTFYTQIIFFFFFIISMALKSSGPITLESGVCARGHVYFTAKLVFLVRRTHGDGRRQPEPS